MTSIRKEIVYRGIMRRLLWFHKNCYDGGILWSLPNLLHMSFRKYSRFESVLGDERRAESEQRQFFYLAGRGKPNTSLTHEMCRESAGKTWREVSPPPSTTLSLCCLPLISDVFNHNQKSSLWTTLAQGWAIATVEWSCLCLLVEDMREMSQPRVGKPLCRGLILR